MKIETIKIDFTAMLYAGILYTGLVISGWLLIRLTIACFKLPSILNAADESKNKTKRTSTIGISYIIYYYILTNNCQLYYYVWCEYIKYKKIYIYNTI